NRPNIVNNSWGGGGGDTWYQAKVVAWRAAGIFPAFSAGNSGSACSSLGSPGDYQESFASASHQSSRTISSFSSRGASAFGDDPYTKPNISAPGSSICSSVPTDGWDCSYSGTSMASPHTAGAVALLWSCNASLIGDMAATFEVLQDTADVAPDGNCGAPADGEGNYTYGYGYLNVLAAGAQVCSSGTIAGTVTDGTNPVGEATVTADDGAGLVVDVVAGADGTYILNAPEGTYTVSATKYGYSEDVETNVVVTEGATTTVDFVITPFGTTTVSGYVYDAGVVGLGSHGYPLYASIHITATGFDETVYADPLTGYYEIELVEDTEHTFTVNAVPTGYETLVEAVTPTGTAYSHDIALLADAEACAAPGYQPDYDIFYNFEGSDEGFTPGGTTSFAWGDFTSGPGEGHSGTKGIATNPGGDYNPSELGWMVSPVIDLTGYGTDTPVIQWYDYKDMESASYDWGRVDVTKDGGATWTTVYGPVGGVHDTQYNQQTAVLDPTYNVSNFQFRFYFKSDGSVQYAGWYVDDIGIISVPVPPPTVVYSSNFDTDNGGFTVSGTTSWAWGAPTSGPSAPYSAPNVWATNLSGDYGNNESGWITSPVIDLSAHAGLAPTISFYHWNEIEGISWDWGAVEVTKDGGATWTDVSGKIGDVSPWSLKTIALDPTYAVSNFQFRFYFHSDGSGVFAGWYIDDVAVSVATPVVIAAPCVVIPGGVVAGYVYDENSGDPLVGADVVSPTVATQTFELAGDPDNAGLYWVFQPTTTDPEDVVFTASKDLFGDDTATVSVAQDEINPQDFELGTGHLIFDPTSFEVTMQMGDPAANHILAIGNDGSADATFELAEKDQGYAPPLSIPAFTGTLPESNAPASTGPAPEAASAPALSSNANLFDGILSGEPAFAVDLMTDSLAYIPDTTIPGTWNVVGATMTSLFAGDFISGDFSTLYAISYDNNNLYTVDTATGAYTLVGPAPSPAGNWTGLTGTPDGTLYGLTSVCNSSTNLVTVDPATGAVTDLGSLAGITCGIDLAYNTDEDMIYIVDIVSNELYRVDPVTLAITDVGALGVDANFAQGMDYEEETGILYWAAYTSAGELRVIDMTTGASTLVGAFPSGTEVDSLAFTTGGAADVPWLSEDPVSGTVPAAGSTDVTLTIDPASLGQPGDYLAALKVKHNTPYTYPNIPVTLHLLAPENYGTFNGTAYGLEACDVNPAPLEGATVEFWQSGVVVYTTTTLADGYYSYSMPDGTYDISVTIDGYVSGLVEGVALGAGETVTTDFNLRLLAPCLSVSPTSLEKSLAAGSTTSQTLTLTNDGAAPVDFELMEMEATNLMADVELILDDGGTENGIGIGGTLEFLWLNQFTPAPDAFPFTLDEIQVYFDSTGMVSVGDDIILVVYENTSGNADPAVGANWLYSYPTTIQTLNAWNNYTLPEGVALDGPGDVLIGVIGLETPGTSYWPAAIDTTTTQGRSWAGWYVASPPPTPPVLPPDDTWGLIDDFGFPGNWMIRGMGTSAAADILWLSEDPVAGTVPADSTLPVTVTYDSTGLALGDYFATLKVKNAPAPAIEVPVTMHVIGSLPIYLPLISK
ncbi:MAG: carboxypeptidase regulatory-like domain-containing protein, partial [Anaerolineaceae bacterium]